MPKSTIAGAGALLVAPLLALLYAAVAPTVSDEAADQLAALTGHRGAQIAALGLQTLAITLLTGGTIWLAVTLARRARGLALAGGILGVAGSLVVLFEDGIAAAAPSVVRGLDPAQAGAVLDRIGSSAAVSVLEPFSLVGDLGLALLGVAAVKAGAPRWVAVAVAVGAFGESAGFATGTRALLLGAFAVLFVGLVAIVRSISGRPVAQALSAPAVA